MFNAGFLLLERTSTLLPSGLEQVRTEARATTLADPSNPLSFDKIELRSIVGADAPSISTYDAASRRWTTLSPEGRMSTSTLDAQGRLVRTDVPGLARLSMSYDTRGRLESVSRGSGVDARTTVLGYLPR